MDGLPECTALGCSSTSPRASSGSWLGCACTIPLLPDSLEGLVPFGLSPLWHWEGPESHLVAEGEQEAGCAPGTITAVGDWLCLGVVAPMRLSWASSAADRSSQGRSKTWWHRVHAFCLSCLTQFQSHHLEIQRKWEGKRWTSGSSQ